MEEQITIRIPRDLARALTRKARQRGVKRSLLVREAIARYVAEPEPAPSTASTWERIRHHVGSMPLDQNELSDDPLVRQIHERNWRWE
jgi:predicted DNA-binding protein